MRPIRVTEINPAGAGLAVLGVLAVIVSVFLPLGDVGAVPVQKNSLIQSYTGLEAAVRHIILAVTALALTYTYYRHGWVGFGVAIAGGAIAVGAIVDLQNDDFFTLTAPEDLDRLLGGAGGERRADAGIALYVTAVGGALVAVGGVLMRSGSQTANHARTTHLSGFDNASPAHGRWEPDPRNPEELERWREGTRWTRAIRKREQS